MITIQLTTDEASILYQSLQTLLSDVRMEMCDTDRADFRDVLRLEKGALERVLDQLRESVPGLAEK